MHDGGEDTLEKVVDFYDKGGNANEFLDPKMRDYDTEKAYLLSVENKTAYKGPPAPCRATRPTRWSPTRRDWLFPSKELSAISCQLSAKTPLVRFC